MIFQYEFERTEFSDEVHGVFGRILILATRFDSSCKTLARLPSIKTAIATKQFVSEQDLDKLLRQCLSSHKNLNRAIQTLPVYKVGGSDILNKARDARNELIHSATLGFQQNIDKLEGIDRYMQVIANQVRDLVRGDILISAVITLENKEDLPMHCFSKEYERSVMKWVFQRFET
ncbi:hypothetical protein HYO58_22935 [Vibrio parahaemolyticus]|nr:hypothetical protein [Vibrio parahaemolyticus]